MTRYAVNCSLLFTELPLLDRPAAAAAAGFDAVEFWWPFADTVPAEAEVAAFLAAVDSAGVRLVQLNFAAGDMPAGERGLVSDPARSAEFRANVDAVAAIAERTGTRAFNALYGVRLPGVEAAEQDAVAAANLAYAASTVDGTVLVEPLTRGENGDYPLATAAEVLAVLDRVPADNVALLADLYHLTSNGDDLHEVITAYAARIGHVQVADAPGRHEPGTGAIDFAAAFADLDAVGYTGYVGLEYHPLKSTVDSLGWLTGS